MTSYAVMSSTSPLPTTTTFPVPGVMRCVFPCRVRSKHSRVSIKVITIIIIIVIIFVS